MKETLSYSAPPRRYDQFVFEETPASATLFFPSVPRWHRWLAIVSASLGASVQTVAVIALIVQYRRLISTIGTFPTTMPINLPWVPHTTYVYALGAIFWWGALFLELRRQRRWADALTSLEVTPKDLTWMRRSAHAQKMKRFDAADVIAISTKPIKDLLRRGYFTELRFVLRKGRSPRWIVRSRDPEFAGRVANAFRRMLHLSEYAHTDSDQTRRPAG